MLHHSANLGYELLLSIILEADKSLLDSQTVQGFTPLYIAVRKRHTHVLKLLLDHGANPNLTVCVFYWFGDVRMDTGRLRYIGLVRICWKRLLGC